MTGGGAFFNFSCLGSVTPPCLAPQKKKVLVCFHFVVLPWEKTGMLMCTTPNDKNRDADSGLIFLARERVLSTLTLSTTALISQSPLKYQPAYTIAVFVT